MVCQSVGQSYRSDSDYLIFPAKIRFRHPAVQVSYTTAGVRLQLLQLRAGKSVSVCVGHKFCSRDREQVRCYTMMLAHSLASTWMHALQHSYLQGNSEIRNIRHTMSVYEVYSAMIHIHALGPAVSDLVITPDPATRSSHPHLHPRMKAGN